MVLYGSNIGLCRDDLSNGFTMTHFMRLGTKYAGTIPKFDKTWMEVGAVGYYIPTGAICEIVDVSRLHNGIVRIRSTSGTYDGHVASVKAWLLHPKFIEEVTL